METYIFFLSFFCLTSFKQVAELNKDIQCQGLDKNNLVEREYMKKGSQTVLLVLRLLVLSGLIVVGMHCDLDDNDIWRCYTDRDNKYIAQAANEAGLPIYDFLQSQITPKGYLFDLDDKALDELEQGDWRRAS